MKTVIFLLLLFLAGLSYGQNSLIYNKKNVCVEKQIPAFCNQINADSLEKNIQSLENFKTRFALAENRRIVAEWIKNQFEQYGYRAWLDSFECKLQYPWIVGKKYITWQYNVVAEIEGIEIPEEIFVMGAHYDAILNTFDDKPFTNAPGADDNASGVAAMIEIARVFKINNYKPKSTIRFVAFAAEELGLIGSADYAKKCSNNGDNIRLMINNDMIAFPKDNKWIVNIIGYSNANYERTVAMRCCLTYTKLTYISESTYNSASDSYSFYKQNYPSVFFIEPVLTHNYHTVKDLTKNIDKNYCAEIVKISCAMLLEYNYTNFIPFNGLSDLLKENFFITPPIEKSYESIQNLESNYDKVLNCYGTEIKFYGNYPDFQSNLINLPSGLYGCISCKDANISIIKMMIY